MKFNLKNNLLTLTIFSCITASIGCSSSAKTNTTAETNKPTVNVEKTTAEKTDKYPTSPSNLDTMPISTDAIGDKIGVPECDDYIEKYEACVKGKVPEASRAMLKTSFDQTRKTWEDLAANPQTKASLASACKQAKDMAKQSMSAYACEW